MHVKIEFLFNCKKCFIKGKNNFVNRRGESIRMKKSFM